MKLSKAQKKMIDRLQSGNYTIGYMRNWYKVSNGQKIFTGSKAPESTINALINMGILVENGTQNPTDYSVTVR
jgi:hypothetical protein